VADTQRAERAQSLLRDEEADDARGPDADQAFKPKLRLPRRGSVVELRFCGFPAGLVSTCGEGEQDHLVSAYLLKQA
jgi:hypothetical protein